MPLLTHLQSELPTRDSGDPLTTEEIAMLLRINWDTVNEFTDIPEHQRQQLREATLVRWLLNFEVVRATLRGVQRSSANRPSPGIVGTAWKSKGEQRQELDAVTELLSDSRYETARDALFSAMCEFQEDHYRASRSAAEHARSLVSELIDELDTAVADLDGSSTTCRDKLREHLESLRAAADHLVTAVSEALDGHPDTASDKATVAESHIKAAGQYVAPLRKELRTWIS